MCLTTPATVYEEPERSRSGSLLCDFLIQSNYRRSHGVSLGPHLQVLVWWLENQIRFVRVKRGHYGRVQEFETFEGDAKQLTDGVKDCTCQSVAYSPSEQFCLSFCKPIPQQKESAEPSSVRVLIHELDWDVMQVRAYGPLRLCSESVPTQVDFHPNPKPSRLNAL